MTTLLKAINLGLAFLLELAALAAFAAWGFASGTGTLVKGMLGIGTPVLAALLWGLFAAPKSARRLRGIAYLIFKLVFFALAVAALLIAGYRALAAGLGLLVVINTILLYLWQQESA